jgi:UDP-N-acetylmuramyl pentapeptide synthase
MKALWSEVPEALRGAWAPDSASLEPLFLDAVRPGDPVMIKGSLGSRMGPLVAALKAKFAKGSV